MVQDGTPSVSHTSPRLQPGGGQISLVAMPSVRHFLDAVLPPRCLACGVIDDGASDVCPTCREHLHDARPLGAFVYVGPVADLITRAKYSRDLATARGLARVFAAAVDGLAEDVDAVTFVPAHWLRALQRGFDLPALLADALADRRRRPFVQLLRAKRRDARLAAAGSVEERRALVDGRFVPTASATAWRGKRVLVIDDVHTTGATLSAVVAALLAAGIDAVPLVLAVTPSVDGSVPTTLTLPTPPPTPPMTTTTLTTTTLTATPLTATTLTTPPTLTLTLTTPPTQSS